MQSRQFLRKAFDLTNPTGEPLYTYYGLKIEFRYNLMKIDENISRLTQSNSFIKMAYKFIDSVVLQWILWHIDTR